MPKEVRGAIDRIVAAAQTAFGPHLRCVTLKGSLLKGDFLPRYSDLDIHAYVDPEALEGDRTPKLDFALRFQEAIGPFDPDDSAVSQFQVYFLRADRAAEGWMPAVPGTYEVLYGEPPPALRDWEGYDYVAQARRNLERIPAERRTLIGRILDKPDTSLATYVRLAGTILKGHAYSAAIVVTGDPRSALAMRTRDLVHFLEAQDPALAAFGGYYEFVKAWERVERDPHRARQAFRKALDALQAIQEWASNPA